MNIVRGLTSFLAVVDEGGFTRAAEALGTAQPPLSRSVAELERHVGARLFDRGNRGVRLTEAGQRLLPEARELTRRLSHLPQVAGPTPEGEAVRLGIPDSTDPTRIAEVQDDLELGGRPVRLVPVAAGNAGADLAEARLDAALTVEPLGAAWPQPQGPLDWALPLVAASTRFAAGPAIPLDELRGRPALGPGLADAEESDAILVLPEDEGLRRSARHLSALVSRGITFRQLVVAESEFSAVSHVTTHGSVLLCLAAVARKYSLPFRTLADGGLARRLVWRGSPRVDLPQALSEHPRLATALQHILEAEPATAVRDDLAVVHLDNRRVDERLFPI